jgi:RNA polymerase sigma-70 factor (ECF subfamily)
MGLSSGHDAACDPACHLAFHAEHPGSESPSCNLAGVRACIQTCLLQPRQVTRASIKTGSSGASLLPPSVNDPVLVEALRQGDAEARVTLLERFEPFIERLVAGTLGFHPEFADIVTQVFVLALERIHQLKQSTSLASWIGSLAVLTARDHISRGRRRRWLRLFLPGDARVALATPASPECCELLRGTFRVLDALPADDRIAFSLRFIANLELGEVAAVCPASLETVSRRIARAAARFRVEAGRDPVLGRELRLGRVIG